jgi:cobalt-zinc-cadmium resistance protein CzcA
LDSTSFESCGYNARQEVLDRLQLATLPAGVNPGLGPDYSPTGQIMFYTLHSASPKYDVMELKTLNEWYVVNQLKTVPNVVDEQGFVVPSSRKPMRRMRSCNETHPGSFLQLRSCTLKTGDFDTGGVFSAQGTRHNQGFWCPPPEKVRTLPVSRAKPSVEKRSRA